MEDFEACAEPLQDCLNATEQVVQESSARLHDLTGKKLELHKLQVLTLPIWPQHLTSYSQPLTFKCQPLDARVPPSLFLSFAEKKPRSCFTTCWHNLHNYFELKFQLIFDICGIVLLFFSNFPMFS